MLTPDHRRAPTTTGLAPVFLWTSLAAIGLADEVTDDLIPEYASYAEVDFLRVSTGTVKARRHPWFIAGRTADLERDTLW